MRFLRFGPSGQEKPGVLDPDGMIRDLSGTVSDINPTTLAAGTLGGLTAADLAALPRVQGQPRVGPCVGGVGKRSLL